MFGRKRVSTTSGDEYGKQTREEIVDEEEDEDEEEEEEEGQGSEEDNLSQLNTNNQYYGIRRDWNNQYPNNHLPPHCRYEDLSMYSKEIIPDYPPIMWNRPDTMNTFRCHDPMEIYCTVPGRTSLLSSTTKYNVSVAEIQRRINPPECLNASLLGGILRKAKSKDGGKDLRDSLRKLGIVLPAGRRKQTSVTCWTALVEEEAIHMARDFSLVCEKEFHSREVAMYMMKGDMNHTEYTTRRMTFISARQIIDEFISILSSDRTPIAGSLHSTRSILDPILQSHLSHFSLVTHGFGCVAICSSLGVIRSIIDEALILMDRPTHFDVFHHHKNCL